MEHLNEDEKEWRFLLYNESRKYIKPHIWKTIFTIITSFIFARQPREQFATLPSFTNLRTKYVCMTKGVILSQLSSAHHVLI